MTKRRQKYLAQYPQRIARKRLKRRRIVGRRTKEQQRTAKSFREILERFGYGEGSVRMPIKAGKPTIAERIKNMIKPSV